MKIDYYKILGLDRNADFYAVKKAYRSLAMKYHPDRNPEDESSVERFKLVTEAYEVLKDSEKRDEYDRIVSNIEFQEANGFDAGNDDFMIPEDELLGDFLRGFFDKQQSSKKKGHDGEDLRYNLKLTFNEAAKGLETQIKIPCENQCPQCAGTGLKAGAKAVVCSSCKGKGKVGTRRGVFKTCNTCNGSGAVMTGACKRCNGSGIIKSRRSIPVKIPGGVETGARLQLRGMGKPGSGGCIPGSLFLVIHVMKHPLFKKQNLNIICDIPIPFFKAILGCSIDIPVLEGMKRIKIPAGTRTGHEIKLRGKGICSQDNKKRGDFIARLTVELPKKISREDRRTLKMFEKKFNPANYPLTLKFSKNMDDAKNENS